jgi:outer membrane protein TolC
MNQIYKQLSVFCVGFFLSLLSLCVLAQSASDGFRHDFNLQECIDYAFQHQDSIKNAKLDVESADHRVKGATGMGFPQISGTANLQDFLQIPTQLLPGDFFGQPGVFIPIRFGVKYQSSIGVNVSQILFDGTYLVGLSASKTYKELSQRNLTRTKIAARIAISKAYYQVLVSGEQLKLIDANLNQLKQQLDETIQLNEQGFAEKIDVDRLRVLYNNLNTDRANSLRMLALGYQILKFQIGMPLRDVLIIRDKIEDVFIENDVELVKEDSTAYKNRIEYKLLETAKALNELQVKRYKNENLPKLSAFGNHNISYQDDSFKKLFDTNYPSTIIGLTLNIPIFSGFQQLNKIRQAKIEVQKSQNNLEAAEKGIDLQIHQARAQYDNGVESLANQKSKIALAQEVLRVSKIKYEEGVGSSIEVTQAQTALQEAENNYIQALFTVLISKVDLQAALGIIK